jgi:hypothetical protein
MKDSRTVGAKRKKMWGRSGEHFISGGRKRIILLAGSNALSVRPSDNDRTSLKSEAHLNNI